MHYICPTISSHECPPCVSKCKQSPRPVPWLATEPTSLKRLQNHLMLITKWNLGWELKFPSTSSLTHVLLMSYISVWPQSPAFLYKRIHTRVMASSQPATFLTASLISALSCQESSDPITTSGSCCASMHIVVLHFPASPQSWLLLQALWTVLQNPMWCSRELMGILYRGLTEDAQWMQLCSNKGISSYIMIDLPLASPEQGFGLFILELSI